MKYRKHPSINAIEIKYEYVFSFRVLDLNDTDIEKEILSLNGNEASQNFHMPIKVIKENLDIFSSFLYTSFNSSKKKHLCFVNALKYPI